MIIDEILEAKEGQYDARNFYELSAYIDQNGYSQEIKSFINKFNWI